MAQKPLTVSLWYIPLANKGFDVNWQTSSKRANWIATADNLILLKDFYHVTFSSRLRSPAGVGDSSRLARSPAPRWVGAREACQAQQPHLAGQQSVAMLLKSLQRETTSHPATSLFNPTWLNSPLVLILVRTAPGGGHRWRRKDLS